MSARRRIRSAAKGAATGGVAPELPSDVDHTANLGSQTESMAIGSSTIGPVSTGSQTERMDLASVILMPDMGIQTESMAQTTSGVLVAPTGSETHDMGGFDVVIPPAGNTTFDAGPSGYDGTLAGATGVPARVTSPWTGFGNALTFTRANTHRVEMGVGVVPARTGTQPFTIEARFNYDGDTSVIQTVAANWMELAGRHNWILRISTGAIGPQFFIENATPASQVLGPGPALSAGLHTLAGVFDGTNLYLYVDGTRVAGPTAIGGGGMNAASNCSFLIGAQQSTTTTTFLNAFNGTIDEVRYSSVARYTGASYVVDTAPWTSDANTIGLWHFDDYSGTIATEISAVQAVAVGQQTESMAASTTLDAVDYTETASATGTPAWSTPTNAQGATDGTETASSLTAGNTANSQLNCTLLKLPPTPAGFTRTGAFIRIVHRWDRNIAVPLTDTVTQVLTVRNSLDLVTLQTLFTRTEDSAPNEQLTLTTEEFSVAGLSDADLVTNGVRVRCAFTGSLTAIVGGNASWTVDSIHIVGRYTQTGLT